MTESKLQSTCYQWAHNTFAELRGLIFSVPNGGFRNMREAQTLKASGVVAGIPDMLILFNGVHGIEFKTEKGVLSESQKKIHKKWIESGLNIHVIRIFEDFKTVVLRKILYNEQKCR